MTEEVESSQRHRDPFSRTPHPVPLGDPTDGVTGTLPSAPQTRRVDLTGEPVRTEVSTRGNRSPSARLRRGTGGQGCRLGKPGEDGRSPLLRVGTRLGLEKPLKELSLRHWQGGRKGRRVSRGGGRTSRLKDVDPFTESGPSVERYRRRESWRRRPPFVSTPRVRHHPDLTHRRPTRGTPGS